jgi:hypothetical protein
MLMKNCMFTIRRNMTDLLLPMHQPAEPFQASSSKTSWRLIAGNDVPVENEGGLGPQLAMATQLLHISDQRTGCIFSGVANNS